MWLEKQQAWEEEGSYCVGAFRETFWYVAPSVTTPQSLNMHPLQLAITLHNAKLAKGRAPAHISMISSVNASVGRPDDPLEAAIGGSDKKKSELFLDSVRKKVNPRAPSRLACYFISMDEATAKRRMGEIRGQRAIYPCRILLDGPVHFGDITLFDEIYNAMGYERATKLAEQYWDPNNSTNTIPKENLEILIGGSLYFPDWETFPLLDHRQIGIWEVARKAFVENS
jgi:hypothetical protein